TAGNPAGSRTPIHFPADRQCLEAISQTVGKMDPAEVRIGWIVNTMQLGAFAFSENVLSEVNSNPALEVVSPPMDLPYDAEGNLLSLKELLVG
ncbi:MAG TPA: hypothetical protein VLH09_14935, partial [Bryobacteraceae bacterium]|nr:hypothetical protein [Bryobacteraceae bacterium]